MDDIVSKALRRLRDIDLERRNIEVFLSTYETLTGTKIERDELLAVPNSRDHIENNSETRSSETRRKPKPSDIANMVERILLEKNRPLTRGEIVEELEKRDVVLESPDKAKYVGTILWRHRDRFPNREGEGYWVKERFSLPGLPMRESN